MQRREFLSSQVALGLSAAGGAVAQAAPAGSNDEILLYVFLRGGADGMNIMPPLDGPDRGHYERYRPTLKVPASGAGAAIPLDSLDGTPFGLHPAAAPLMDHYRDRQLAIVQSVGMPNPTRSHFDAQAYCELGTPGTVSTATGWLARHFATMPGLPATIPLPILAVNQTPPTSLLGNRVTLTMLNTERFNLGYGHWKWDDPAAATIDRDATLRALYAGRDAEFVGNAGLQALNAAAIIQGSDFATGGVAYPETPFGEALQTVAQVIKLDVGLRIATVDIGAWDTHVGQDDGNFFADQLLGPLAQGLATLLDDLQNVADVSRRLTIVVHSEFGRRMAENADAGTDHGVGNLMLLLGETINGGLYGEWPGIAPEQLFEGEDLAATVDFRSVLDEVLVRRFDNTNRASLFPGLQASAPLNAVRWRGGAVAGDELIFANGFD